MSRLNDFFVGVLAGVAQTHQPAARGLTLPQPAVGTLAAGWLAGRFKPARMPHLAVPCRRLPQPAA